MNQRPIGAPIVHPMKFTALRSASDDLLSGVFGTIYDAIYSGVFTLACSRFSKQTRFRLTNLISVLGAPPVKRLDYESLERDQSGDRLIKIGFDSQSSKKMEENIIFVIIKNLILKN